MGTFFERLIAYVADIFIVSLLLGLIGYGLPDTTSKVNDELKILEEKYIAKEITEEVYLEEYYNLFYDLQVSSKLTLGVTLGFTIAYYVVFQTLYNGQTLGKKIFRLRVVDSDNKEKIGFVRMFCREVFTMSIFSSMCNLIFLFVFKKDVYLVSYMGVFLCEGIFIILSMLFVLYRKDKRGLHDILAKTCVVKEV